MTVDPAAEARAFRCSVGAADEPMAGSAAEATSYLLVEHPGPWGRKALAESRFPEEVRHGLAEAGDAAGVRVQLIRRPGRSSSEAGLRVFFGYADPVAPWLATARLPTPEDLLGLDLPALAGGSQDAVAEAGLEPHDEPLFLVCTNGRRDLCCAEQGRPIVTALAEAHPTATWETTHVGGHRFAGAMVVLPHGLSYGRLGPASALDVARLTLTGTVALPHLRGRSAYPGAVQAAEVAVRERLGETGVDALRLVGAEPLPDGATAVTFDHATGPTTVEVERVASAPARQSCADLVAKPGSRYVVR